MRILGSMHLFPASAPHVPRWAQNAYAWCDCLVFESDLNAFRPYLTAEDDVALSTKLSPSIYDALKRLWPGDSGMSPLHQLRPWAAAMMTALLHQQASVGIEPIFIEWALEDGKSIEYLELPSAFPALMDAVPLSVIESTVAVLLADLGAPQRSLTRCTTLGLASTSKHSKRPLKSLH